MLLWGKLLQAVRWVNGCDKGGILFPTDMYGKIGNKVADILASKHPSLTPPDMEEFLWYEGMPTLMEINIML